MEIILNRIAKNLKIGMPDLITRPIGKRIYRSIAKQLEKINNDEVVVIDFNGILVLDPSCSDEIIVKLINDSRSNEHPFYLRLKNISEMTEMNLASVFESYHEYSKERIAVITEDITSKNLYCIGGVSNIEHEIIKYLKVNKESNIKNIAEYLNEEVLKIEEVLKTMHNLRIVRISKNKNNHVYLSV